MVRRREREPPAPRATAGLLGRTAAVSSLEWGRAVMAGGNTTARPGYGAGWEALAPPV
jgi:hypothetical protein